ncbi:MAG: ClbS/DfsB family four-helix bundle protein [Oscillospiraceae bacterium]|nr:ClbS/DfsB family four-helix bundle protein [Oscillospiraceae bacterium]
MAEYKDKNALVSEIKKTSELFIKEFDDIEESDRHIRYDDVDRTPQEMLAYQLGWMSLIRGWDNDELNGNEVITPAPGYKWNQMGALYQGFYEEYQDESLAQMRSLYISAVDSLIIWLDSFSDDELFEAGGRKWSSSTASNWPIWKWVHTNTVAPFKSFRSKIRKWKKLHSAK